MSPVDYMKCPDTRALCYFSFLPAFFADYSPDPVSMYKIGKGFWCAGSFGSARLLPLPLGGN